MGAQCGGKRVGVCILMASYIHVMLSVEMLATWSKTQRCLMADSVLHSFLAFFVLYSQEVCIPRILPFESRELIGVSVVSLCLSMPLVPPIGSVGGHIL
jgi:hypothetical protein